MTEVFSLGELLIDFTCTQTDPNGYPTMAAHPGGAVANFLAALAKYGTKTALFTKVGDDVFGSLLTGTLEKLHIDTRGVIRTKDAFTTLAFVTLDDRGVREFSFARKPGADTCIAFEELELSLVEDAKVFHFGTLSLTHEPARTATQKTVAHAKSKGMLISFDPNLREPLWEDLQEAKKQILWGLSQADVVKISDNEVDFLFGMTPQVGAAHILEDFGAKLVYVTCGAKGCYYKNKNAEGMVYAPDNFPVVDTTGAGDIFGGSAMWKLMQLGAAPESLTQTQLQQIVTFACTAATLSTTKPGGASSVPTLEEIKQLLQ